MTRHNTAPAGGTDTTGAVGMRLLGMVLAADQASATYYETGWGSLAKSAPAYSTKTVTGVHAAAYPRYDRIVIDVGAFGSRNVGYDVRYVDGVSDPDGRPVGLRGGAALQVTVQAPAYDHLGMPTYLPHNDAEVVPVSSYRTFDQAAWAGSSEGRTTLGLGVRARLPMRAFLIPADDGGRRVVVDVAHSW